MKQPLGDPLPDGLPASESFLQRVKLRNYKSISSCDVKTGRLCFLVGPNGSGKSNFLDALRFVSDSLRFSLDHALRDRGGINEVRRRSGGHPTHFGIRLEFVLSPTYRGYYAFEVAAKSEGGYAVSQEQCEVRSQASYKIVDGEVQRVSVSPAPAASRDRLYLVAASGIPELRPLYDALASMGFYNLNPEQIRDLQPPDPGELLHRDGNNIASVLAVLATRRPALKQRIEQYLANVVPGIIGFEPRTVGPRQTVEFRQEVRGSRHPWRFIAANMSDGTLRALGVLVAVFQGAATNSGIHLVGIEEPEAALHPAAAGTLRDALKEASNYAQILVTSHSPDLLDDASIPDESILAVVAEHGETKIGPVEPVGRSALRDGLYTAGELLRMDQLKPDMTTLAQQELFDDR